MRRKKIFFRNSLIVIHILFALAGLTLYIINYQTAENLLIQNKLQQERTLAKAGALSIEDLFTTVQNELNSFVFSFTKINDYQTVDISTTRLGFMSYIQRAQLPITGIAYYDQNGKLAIIEDRQDLHTGEGEDFSNTPFIIWAKNPLNKNRLYISTPYISTAGGSVGKTIIFILKPIYFGNSYKGALSIRILLDDLQQAFVSPLISDVSEHSFIIDSSGTIIAGQTDLLNKNLFLYAEKQKWDGYTEFTSSLRQALVLNDIQSSWIFKYPSEQQPHELLVGISRIDVSNTDKDLFLIVTTPKNNILSLLSWLRSYGYIWLGFSALFTIIGSCIVIFLQDKQD